MATLRLGSKGNDVIKLQLLLNRSMKPSPRLKADGNFGGNTQKALIKFQQAHKLTADGIVGKQTWKALGVKTEPVVQPSAPSVTAPWYDIAKAELGIAEISGPDKHNQRILAYHSTTTLGAKTDEIPWCSSFVNWVMTQAGIKGTNNALAKSWATWGVKAQTPSKGTIVVIKKKSSNSDASTGSSTGYHVGFYESATQNSITLLGGNQSDKVKYSTFYFRTYDVIAYRRPLSAILGVPLQLDSVDSRTAVA